MLCVNLSEVSYAKWNGDSTPIKTQTQS
jgi:hypothetical protein